MHESKGLAPGTVASVYRTFSKIMRTAVVEGVVVKSPCVGIDLPREHGHEEMKFLTPEQVSPWPTP